MQNQNTEGTSTLARILRILTLISDVPAGLGNHELAERTGIPRPTVSRITSGLVRAGLVRQRPGTELFVLGPGVLNLSQAFLDQLDVRAIFRERFTSVAETLGAAVHLGFRDRMEMVLVETVQPRAATLITRQRVGSRMDMVRSAMGRAYVAGLPEAERDALRHLLLEVGATTSEAFSTSYERAKQELAQYGCTTSFGDWNPIINAIATWVHAPDGEMYSISCGGPAHLLSSEFLLEVGAQQLRTALEDIQQATGIISGFTRMR